jgi:hypothetical protein
MAINCRPFVSYLGELLIPLRAFNQARDDGMRRDHLTSMGWANATLWTSGICCGLAALAYKFTAGKPLPHKLAKLGICVYGSVAVLAVVISFAKFCREQANQRR